MTKVSNNMCFGKVCLQNFGIRNIDMSNGLPVEDEESEKAALGRVLLGKAVSERAAFPGADRRGKFGARNILIKISKNKSLEKGYLWAFGLH